MADLLDTTALIEAADKAGFDLGDIESSFFDQVLNWTVQVAAAGNPLPNWI